MSKKLTREMVEKMVLQTMNESKEVNEIFGIFGKAFKDQGKPASTPFGRKPTLPKSGKAENDAVQLLRMLLDDPKLPKSVKGQIEDFLEYTPEKEDFSSKVESTPRMTKAELDAAMGQRLGAKGAAPITTAIAGEYDPELEKIKSTPEEFSLPSASKKVVSIFPTAKDFGNSRLSKVSEGHKFEALVAEVLKEMSKKQPAKEPKKPVKK